MEPTATHLPILRSLLSGGKIKKVLEFGCGHFSTRTFLEAGCELTSIEMQNESWFNEMKEGHPDIRLCLGPFDWRKEALADRYDLIFVDGHGDSRWDCLIWAKDHTDLIVAHDTEHPYYCWHKADMSGFTETVHKIEPPWTTVWVRG